MTPKRAAWITGTFSRLSGIALSAWLATLVWSPAASADPEDIPELLEELRSSDEDDRADAAEELRDDGPPPAIAVWELLAAAHVETDSGALGEMLLTLGESGMLEALGLIQTHARSPVDHVRGRARKGLKAWLVRNGVISQDAELPDPPHHYYDTRPHVSPASPAAHALNTWRALPPGALAPSMLTPSVLAPGVLAPGVLAPGVLAPGAPHRPPAEPPLYVRPDPDGLPYGYRVESRPRKGLVIAGATTFGSLYAITLSAAAAAGSDDTGMLAMPVAGPFVVGVKLFDERGDFAGLAHLVGGLMVLDGMAQLAGLSMLTIGLAASEDHLERDGPEPLRSAATPEVLVSPSSMGLRWQF